MKNIYFAIALISPFLLTGCGTKPTELPANTETIFSLGESYVIGSESSIQKDVYGIVIAENIRNIISTIGGFISTLDCQPGKAVFSDDIIAEIIPNQNDPAIKNLYIQEASLREQIKNIEESYDMTEQNFELQKETLLAQTENNQEIYEQDSPDLIRLEHNIQNFKNQQTNTINDTFKKIRSNGGDTRYSDLYEELIDERDDIQDLSDDDFSEYLANMAELSEIAAEEASGDNVYSMFIGLSNGFRTSKSSFDNLIDSYFSAKNVYENQNRSLGTNLDLIDEQIQNIENTKTIQLNALENQRRSTQQILDGISNSLNGEYLYAGVDGIVKAKLVGLNNKISPNTMICQIIPKDSTNKKIQIYSPNKIAIGQIVKIFKGDTLLGAKKIEYELPYTDTLTQNYVYEINNINFDVKEGEKVNIQFFKKIDSEEVWIPINFIFSKLDGNYVRIKNGTGFIETKVDLGDINNKLVKVISGANIGQTIVN